MPTWQSSKYTGLLTFLIQFACANVLLGQDERRPDHVNSRLGADNELRIFLPPSTRIQPKTSSPRFRTLAFSNMESRGREQSDGLNDGSAILIKQIDGSLAVHTVDSPRDPVFAEYSGLLIWSENGQEHWKMHLSPRDVNDQKLHRALASNERSAVSGGSSVVGASTNPLQQLAGMSLVRGAGGLVSPIGGVKCLNPVFTIRRSARKNNSFPKLDVTLWRGKLKSGPKKLATFVIPEGIKKIRWDEIENLPAKLQKELPPGVYSFTIAGSKETVDGFEVGDGRTYAAISGALDRLVPADSELPSGVAAVLKIEILLGMKDQLQRPTPFYCDALDMIDSLSEIETGSGLEAIRQIIRSKSGNADEPELDDYPTGITEIDDARKSIAQGNWTDAILGLKSLKQRLSKSIKIDTSNDGQLKLDDSRTKGPHLLSTSESRISGLVALYEAVILAEAGTTKQEEADRSFRRAISILAESKPADRWRAHNNYGVFLLGIAQDLLNNHSLQIASGVRRPLSRALINWQKASDAFSVAEQLAEQVDQGTLTNVIVNQARLNAIMVDMLATLSFSSESDNALKAMLIEQANKKARTAATIILETENLDPLIRGSAAEILAQLAFRKGDLDSSTRHIEFALNSFVDAASLAGIESSLRLKGLIGLSGDQASKKKGLSHLTVSFNISDILYQRIPSDATGRSRAGFFSRRAYVVERIVEQLVDAGDAETAVEFVEHAKAQSLREVLATRALDIERLRSAETKPRSVEKVAAELKDGTVILEYFLTSEHAYAFLISNAGVESSVLTEPDGSPLSSRQLVKSVIRMQQEMGHTAKKMLARSEREMKLENNWQHDLHQLYRRLIPRAFVDEVTGSDKLVIVPHHVLHYVPFSALVTELDPEPNAIDRPQVYGDWKSGGIAQPKFLIDAGMSMSIAPSIASWDLIRQRDIRIDSASAVGIAEFDGWKPLPGVREDMRSFREIFGDRTKTILQGKNADESKVRQMLSSPGVLVLATHGQNFADNPLTSFMVCHPSEADDGLLTAMEIFRSKIKSELVVMSACYTGLADRSPLPGDDLFGLQRAFLFSGSSAVVSGLWDVYDTTGPILITRFFQHFVNGQSADQALSNAQRDFLTKLRKSEDVEFYLHPYFWSVYNISGDGGIVFSAN